MLNLPCAVLSLTLIGVVLILASGLGSEVAFAQQSESGTAGLGFIEIVEIAGVAGIISAIVSSYVNYKFSNRASREERQRQAAKDRVSLYSLFIFNLMRMIENEEFRTGGEQEKKIADTFKEMDDMMKNNFYAIEQKIFSKWLSVRSNWQFKYKSNRREFFAEVIGLRNMLVKLYNGNISDYQKKLSVNLDKIESDTLDVSRYFP
jgi:hypothetical protein